MVISEKQLGTLVKRLSQISLKARKRSDQVWKDESMWLRATLSLNLVREVRSVGVSRPGSRVMVSGSYMLDQAADRWRGRVRNELNQIIRDFREDTYRASRIAYGLPITRGGISQARSEMTGGDQPRGISEWLRSFALRYGSTIEDLVISASSDGDDLDDSIRLAESRINSDIPAIGRSFNAVLLSPGGSALRVAASE